jgi:hypothetical protein
MLPLSAVSSVPAGGSREQEQGAAQGGSEVLVSGRGGYPANGEWRMANGEWRMANGEWRMANGEWRVASGTMKSRWRLHHSLFTVHCGHSPLICVARRPADGLSRDAPATSRGPLPRAVNGKMKSRLRHHHSRFAIRDSRFAVRCSLFPTTCSLLDSLAQSPRP